MNVTNLIKAIHVMDRLVTERSELHDINMLSTQRPACGTPGCHAGLWYATFQEVGIDPNLSYNYGEYDYDLVADKVCEYLDISRQQLPEYWPFNCASMCSMWSQSMAFGVDNEAISGRLIVETWKQYLNNYLAAEKFEGSESSCGMDPIIAMPSSEEHENEA